MNRVTRAAADGSLVIDGIAIDIDAADYYPNYLRHFAATFERERPQAIGPMPREAFESWVHRARNRRGGSDGR